MAYRRRYRNSKQSFSEDVYLITPIEIENDIGEMIQDGEEKRLVMAKETEVSNQNFWNSRVEGLNLEIAFEIKKIEYQREKLLEFNGERYHIRKTYPIGQNIELTCEKVIA